MDALFVPLPAPLQLYKPLEFLFLVAAFTTLAENFLPQLMSLPKSIVQASERDRAGSAWLCLGRRLGARWGVYGWFWNFSSAESCCPMPWPNVSTRADVLAFNPAVHKV